MALKNALESAVEFLDSNDVGSPRMNAEVLLMFTLGCDRAYLYAHPERELTENEQSRYNEALCERARGVPSQYITGHQEFWGLDLIVTPAVLIPRPETEHAVETVLELVRELTNRSKGAPPFHPTLAKGGSVQTDLIAGIGLETEGGSHTDGAPCLPDFGRSGSLDVDPKIEIEDHANPVRIIDVGTGSGCIALALAAELPQADVSAVDISSGALEVALANAARLQLADRVRFLESDLLAAIPEAERFDIIVSNPPYVGVGEADKVQREVKKFEPKVAVFAGEEGLDTIRRLIPQACRHLNSGGWLVMEIGYTQSETVRGLLADWAEVRITHDLQGIPRVISARKACL
jgi:release factor glutamine methyltransferase